MSTTIGKVAYIATWDATQLVKGIMNSRQQFAAHKKIVEQSQSPLQKYETGLANLRVLVSRFPDLLSKQKQMQGTLNRQYLEAEQAIRKLTAAEVRRLEVLGGFTKQRAMSAGGHFESTWAGTKGAAGAGRGSVGIGAMAGGLAARSLPLLAGGSALYASKNFLRDSILTHASIERNTAAMEVFTGSAADAAGVMNTLRTLSSESGVGFDGLQKSASTLMSFGISVKQTLPAMRQMTEITRGDSQRFEALALAYAQAGAAGKLMGQELLQMVNAGFNPLKEISRTTGIGISELRKEMERGRLSFDLVAKAFETATSEGGKFHGMMENIAATSAGSISRLGAEWSIFLDKFGTSMEPATRSVASVLTGSLKTLSTVFSQWDDAVDRRMEAAKKTDGQSIWSDFSISLNGYMKGNFQTDLSKAAMINNKLDAELEKVRERNKAFSQMKEKPGSPTFTPLQATASGSAAISRLQVELGLIDKQVARRKELLNNGMNAVEVNRVMLLERQLEIMNRQKDAMKKQRDSMEEMRSRGADLMKEFQSPAEKLRGEMNDLIALRRAGAIDKQTMWAAANEAAKRATANAEAASRSSSETMQIDSMRAGSQEAYRYLAGIQDRNMKLQLNESRKQLRVQSDILFVLKRANELLAEVADTTFGSDG